MILKTKSDCVHLQEIKAIIFDFDGTLIETEHVWSQAKRQLAAENGLHLTDQDLEPYVGQRLDAFVSGYWGNLSKQNQQDMCSRIYEYATKQMAENLKIIPNASKLMHAFSQAGFRIAVCSSSSQSAIKNGLERLNATHLVEVIVSGSDTTRGKPDPAPYLETLQKLGITPSQAIVFEDSFAGVHSAHSAGITSFSINCDVDFQITPAKIFHIDTLSEVTISPDT